MSNKRRWANIICNREMQPYKLIVTDGDWTSETPVSNTRLETVKKAARLTYDVPKNHILVTQVFENVESKE